MSMGRFLLPGAFILVVLRLAYLASLDADPEPPGTWASAPEVAFLLWEVLCLGVAVGLIAAMRTVDCRLCRGAGRLALEAHPPGEDCFVVDQYCIGCDGAGRLSALDRGVLRQSWD
jgi:hypothetical protein